MPRFFNKFFYKYSIITKTWFCFINRWIKCILNIFFSSSNSHTFSTATCRSFYHNRETNFFWNFKSFFRIFNNFLMTWNYIYIWFFSKNLWLNFITHYSYWFWRRPYKCNSFPFKLINERSVFRKKSISRMNCICTSVFTGIYYFFNN